MGDVVELDAQRPHVVLLERCKACGHRCVGVVPVSADFSKLECSKCGACDSEWTLPNDDAG